MQLKYGLLCSALLSGLIATPANAGSAAGTIGASVPLVCEINASAIIVDPATSQASTSVQEMCNGSSGFRVVASYRQLQEGERVTISYAGSPVALEASGITEVAQIPGASLRIVPVQINSTGLSGGLLINLGFAAT